MQNAMRVWKCVKRACVRSNENRFIIFFVSPFVGNAPLVLCIRDVAAKDERTVALEAEQQVAIRDRSRFLNPISDRVEKKESCQTIVQVWQCRDIYRSRCDALRPELRLSHDYFSCGKHQLKGMCEETSLYGFMVFLNSEIDVPAIPPVLDAHNPSAYE